MKKIFIFLAFVLVLGGCSSSKPETLPMPGGIYTAEYDRRGESALKFALNEMGLEGSSYQVSLYKKQIVSGTNHFFIVRVEDISYEIKVYEDLSGGYKLEKQEKIER